MVGLTFVTSVRPLLSIGDRFTSRREHVEPLAGTGDTKEMLVFVLDVDTVVHSGVLCHGAAQPIHDSGGCQVR